jgi:alpha-tubulin suppressor-like RCC1 family protein
MPRTVPASLAIAVVAAIAPAAHAQVCTESAPGTARIEIAATSTTIKVVGGVPRANSVVCGFAATSIEVIGRPANDTIKLNYVPPTVDVAITSGGGADTLVVYGSASADAFICGTNGIDRDLDPTTPDDIVFDVAPSKINIYGQSGNDMIDCTAAPVKTALYGGDGDDGIAGSTFNDTIDGGAGSDYILANAGNDTIIGGFGNDTMWGGAGNDTFPATKSTSGVNDGNDTIAGDLGVDTVSYAKRTEGVVAGQLGEDAIADDVETIRGGPGPDVFDFSSAPTSTPHNLYGAAGNDLLRGGNAIDKLFGEAGNDRLDGRGGKDVLDGGDGNDIFAPTADGFVETIKCGAGRDWYVPAEDPVSACEHAVVDRRRIASGTHHTCAILATGRVKCWGQNNAGQLGLGDTDNRGDQSFEMGNSLPSVDLGTNGAGIPHTAVALALGGNHTCALLDDGAVKCWGQNGLGQLGLGANDNRGDGAGELGDALPPVDLGTGRSAVALAAGFSHTCALLDGGQVKCWGGGFAGALGVPASSIGAAPAEMGDALLPVDLGPGRTAIAIGGGGYFTCALLDNGRLVCWGQGDTGQLGNGSAGNVGDQPGEMGSALVPVDLGTNRLAVDLTSTSDMFHACALLDDGTIKCWGHGGFGGLGTGDTADRGALPGQMGNALPAVDLGTGRTAVGVAAVFARSCAILEDSSLKCWGRNVLGSLGIWFGGHRGDGPGEMGDALPAIDLGTGRTPRAIALGGQLYTCAALDDGSVKCWGNNQLGELGIGTTDNRGDQDGELGDALPAVDLGGPLPAVALAPPALSIENDALEPAPGEIEEDELAPEPLDETSDGAIDDDSGAGGCSAGGSPGGALLFALVIVLVTIHRRTK